MAALLQIQESPPGQGSYWLDISRNNNSIPRSDFSPVYFDTEYNRISSTLHELLRGANLRAPINSGLSTDPHGPELSVELLVCDGGNDGNPTNVRESSLCNNITYITYQSWANASRGYFTHAINPRYLVAESYSLNNTSTRSFDLAYLTCDNILAVWVSGTNVYPIEHSAYSGETVPQVSFPFTRLASIDLPGKSCYLYHQINGTTLAEEQYDFSWHEWLTTYITVPIL